VVRLFLSAAQGLAAAHATGVVHRDVKPANIFLHELPSSEVVPKIFDFGIAKQSVTGEDCEAAVALTQTGGMIGSPLYMSPEQAKNAREVDERSDIWSLGLSLWEALSGRRPWEECTTVGELVLAICTKNVTPLQDVAPWIEPGLAQIVHRCLQRDPQDRYASMSELAKSLEEFAGAGTQLTRASLIPVTAERRASSARRAVLQGYDELIAVKANEGGPNARYSKAEARRLRIGIWVGVGLVASMAAGNHLATKGRPTRIGGAQTASLEQTVIPNVAPVGVSAKKLRVNLEIRPADANVLISGHEMAIANGTVTLEGLPGESFGVVVQTDAGRSEAQVVITTDGRTSPSLIEIPIAQPSRMPGTVAGKRPAAHTTSKVPSEPSPTDANSGMVRPVDSW
jgi:serine/threonine-protein kinase